METLEKQIQHKVAINHFKQRLLSSLSFLTSTLFLNIKHYHRGKTN